MKIFCDDGSTNVKLAWFEGKTLKSAVSSAPSTRMVVVSTGIRMYMCL